LPFSTELIEHAQIPLKVVGLEVAGRGRMFARVTRTALGDIALNIVMFGTHGSRTVGCRCRMCVVAVSSPPFVVAVVFAFREHAVRPGSLGDAAVGVIHCALPIWLVVDRVDLACVGPPLACLRVREGHAEHHSPLRLLLLLLM